MKINIEEINSGNRHKYMDVAKQIFEPEYYVDIEASFDTWIKEKNGMNYFIRDNHEVIGITGYYLFKIDDTENAGIRFHGLLPEHQNKGISKKVIDLIVNDLKNKYSNLKAIYEQISSRNEVSLNYFKKMGFRETTNKKTLVHFNRKNSQPENKKLELIILEVPINNL